MNDIIYQICHTTWCNVSTHRPAHETTRSAITFRREVKPRCRMSGDWKWLSSLLRNTKKIYSWSKGHIHFQSCICSFWWCSPWRGWACLCVECSAAWWAAREAAWPSSACFQLYKQAARPLLHFIILSPRLLSLGSFVSFCLLSSQKAGRTVKVHFLLFQEVHVS